MNEQPENLPSSETAQQQPFERKMGCSFLLIILMMVVPAVIAGLVMMTDELGYAPMFFLFTLAMLIAAFAGMNVFKISPQKLFGSLSEFKDNLSLSGLAIPLIFCSVGIMFTKIIIVYGLMPESLNPFIDSMESSRLDIGDSLTAKIMLILAVVIIGPIAEEILFRGVLFTRWAKVYSPAKAAFYSSALFGIMHANVIGLFFVGWVLCMVYMYTRSLWIPIIIHILNNLFAVLIYAYDIPIFGELSPAWVSQNLNLMLVWIGISFLLVILLVRFFKPAATREIPYLKT